MENLTYSHEIEVTDQFIDELNHVNNVIYVQWIQDIAVKHWYQMAPQHISQSYVWVIVRHEIDYKKPALLHDTLLVKTRVLDAERATSTRLVQFYRKEDMQLLVESKTTWCMIDAQTHRPARITDEIKKMFLGE